MEKHVHKFESSSITPEQLDKLAGIRGCESRAELLRLLVREELNTHDIEISGK